MTLATPKALQAATRHLTAHDQTLAPVIKRAGACTLVPHSDYYGALVQSIIGQQLSVKAAHAIGQRFRDLFDGKLPSPEQILAVDAEQLRAIGFSYAKAKYIHDLAGHILDGTLTFDHIPTQSNEQIVSELIDVKGIGEWTAHMFLIFCVGRLDVLPTGDLGIRNGIRALYGFENVPTPEQVKEVAGTYSWHPYESVASWYVWRSLDNAPKF